MAESVQIESIIGQLLDAAEANQWKEIDAKFQSLVASQIDEIKIELCRRGLDSESAGRPQFAQRLMQICEQNATAKTGSYIGITVNDAAKIEFPSTKDWLGEFPLEFGKYRLVKELGRGGMGVVFLAVDQKLLRNVALKIPLLSHSSKGELSELQKKERKLRFLREAQSMAKVKHPNLCQVYDHDDFGEWHYLVMEYIEGEPLSTHLRKRKIFSQTEAASLLCTVAIAIQALHDQGLVHRDLKPQNIMMTNSFQPIVMDFGLSRQFRDEDESLTVKGGFVGTLAFCSPEQLLGKSDDIGPATDVYTLGVILYQLVTGQLPFRPGPTLGWEILNTVSPPPSKLRPDLDPLIDAICLKSMSKQPFDRYSSAKAFADDLQRVMDCAPLNSTTEIELINPSGPPSQRMVETSYEPVTGFVSQAELRYVTVVAFGCEIGDDVIDENHSTISERMLEQSVTFKSFVEQRIFSLGGVVVHDTGAELIACFGYPQAFEDSAQRAARAAIKTMNDLSTSLPGTNLPNASQCWAVIHSGEAVVEQPDSQALTEILLTGEVRNTVLKIASVTEPGMVVMTAAAHQKISLFFEHESLGSIRVRGAQKPHELFKLIKEKSNRNRVDLVDPGNLSPLVGRNSELATLKERWEHALDGLGQVVLLIGSAGLGKSRLIRELREHVIGDGLEPTVIIEFRCSQNQQGTSFFPAVEYLSRSLDFEHLNEPERLQAVVQVLSELKMESAENISLLCMLLGVPTDSRFPELSLSPKKMKERTELLLLKWLSQLTQVNPVLFIVEDLHWLDPSTLELLEKHVSEFQAGRMLSILTFRPEFETPWKSKPHQTQIALNRLTTRQIGEMVCKRTNRKALPGLVLKSIIERTDGVPLFIEELLAVMIESGVLERADQGEDISALLNFIPAALQDLLLARLNRMGANREVIQLAATIGREFEISLLSAASALSVDQIQLELDKLVTAEILFRNRNDLRANYIFKHALLQDAAYKSMLTKKRQSCHQRVAEAIESGFQDIVNTQPALLAHHFTEAGVTDLAIQYWLKAGQTSQSQSANIAATQHFQRGIELAMTLPISPTRDKLELGLKLPQSAVLMAAKGYSAPEVAPLHDRCIEICRQLGDGSPLFPVLIGKWGWNFIASRFDECHVRCQEVIAIANEKRGPGMIAEAHWTQVCTSFFEGDFSNARQHAEIGLAHYDRVASMELIKVTQQGCGPLMKSFLGLTLWKLGYPDQALATLNESLEMCRELAHPFTQVVVNWEVGQCYDFVRFGEKALEKGCETFSLANELGATWYIGLGLGSQGEALKHFGRDEEAIPMLEQCLSTTKNVGAKCTLGKFSGSLALALWKVGRRDDAWKMLEEALGYLTSGERYIEADLLRYQGDFHRDLEEWDQAEAAYQESLAVAIRQHAKSDELRTTICLGRIWVQQGKKTKARAALAKVFDWFTEGFGTPDLIDAQKLLQEWS
jgi:serine/threonine protein kinase/tetratricopeptide (TPR) repeat protein